MPEHLRKIIAARRTTGARIAANFATMETSARQSASDSSMCVSALLHAHEALALPADQGLDIVELIADAARLATQSCAKIGEAHGRIRSLAIEHGIAIGSAPGCPPNEDGDAAFLKLVR